MKTDRKKQPRKGGQRWLILERALVELDSDLERSSADVVVALHALAGEVAQLRRVIEARGVVLQLRPPPRFPGA